MAGITILSPSAQLAAYLREELLLGRWRGKMPGCPSLAKELGVDGKTVWAALRQLEREGVLIAQGAGKRRKIAEMGTIVVPELRIAILDYEPISKTEAWTLLLQQQLKEQGHHAFFVEKSLLELGFDLKRIARLVKQTPADAWVVCSGSLDVLTWFAQREAPVFALFGRRRSLPIAGVGPDHVSASRAATRRLIELGHRRIVVLVRETQQEGGVGSTGRAILNEMETHGLPTSPYNLPRWKNSPEEFYRVLDELFRITPPTALIIDEPFLFHAAKDHLAQRGILAPTHVSLVCIDPDPTFAWAKPSVAHIQWDHQKLMRRLNSWARNMSQGKADTRQVLTKAKFIEGGTIGPVH